MIFRFALAVLVAAMLSGVAAIADDNPGPPVPLPTPTSTVDVGSTPAPAGAGSTPAPVAVTSASPIPGASATPAPSGTNWTVPRTGLGVLLDQLSEAMFGVFNKFTNASIMLAQRLFLSLAFIELMWMATKWIMSGSGLEETVANAFFKVLQMSLIFTFISFSYSSPAGPGWFQLIVNGIVGMAEQTAGFNVLQTASSGQFSFTITPGTILDIGFSLFSLIMASATSGVNGWNLVSGLANGTTLVYFGSWLFCLISACGVVWCMAEIAFRWWWITLKALWIGTTMFLTGFTGSRVTSSLGYGPFNAAFNVGIEMAAHVVIIGLFYPIVTQYAALQGFAQALSPVPGGGAAAIVIQIGALVILDVALGLWTYAMRRAPDLGAYMVSGSIRLNENDAAAGVRSGSVVAEGASGVARIGAGALGAVGGNPDRGKGGDGGGDGGSGPSIGDRLSGAFAGAVRGGMMAGPEGAVGGAVAGYAMAEKSDGGGGRISGGGSGGAGTQSEFGSGFAGGFVEPPKSAADGGGSGASRSGSGDSGGASSDVGGTEDAHGVGGADVAAVGAAAAESGEAGEASSERRGGRVRSESGGGVAVLEPPATGGGGDSGDSGATSDADLASGAGHPSSGGVRGGRVRSETGGGEVSGGARSSGGTSDGSGDVAGVGGVGGAGGVDANGGGQRRTRVVDGAAVDTVVRSTSGTTRAEGGTQSGGTASGFQEGNATGASAEAQGGRAGGAGTGRSGPLPSGGGDVGTSYSPGSGGSAAAGGGGGSSSGGAGAGGGGSSGSGDGGAAGLPSALLGGGNPMNPINMMLYRNLLNMGGAGRQKPQIQNERPAVSLGIEHL